MPSAYTPSFAQAASELPGNWSVHPMSVDGIDFKCHRISGSGNPQKLVGFCPGFRYAPADFQDTFATLIENGADIVALEMPEVGIDGHFLPGIEAVVHSFFFSKHSLLYENPRDIPVFALSHSMGSMLFQKGLLDDGNKAVAERKLARALNVSTFFDIKNYSAAFDPTRSVFYERYASKHPDRFISNERSPTHGQAFTLKKCGEGVVEQIKAREGNVTSLPQTFIYGSKDRQACPSTIGLVAETLRADSKIFEADHHEILIPERGSLEWIIGAMTHAAPDAPQTDFTVPDNNDLSGLGLT